MKHSAEQFEFPFIQDIELQPYQRATIRYFLNREEKDQQKRLEDAIQEISQEV